MKIDKRRQDYLITQWFNNLLAGKENNEILFLEQGERDDKESITRLLKKYDLMPNQYTVIITYDYINSINIYKHINIILVCLHKDNLTSLRGFESLTNEKLLLLPKESNSYSYIERYLRKEDDINLAASLNKVDLPKELRYLYYVEKVDFIDLVKNKFIDKLFNILTILKKRIFIFYEGEDALLYLIRQTSFKRIEYEQSLKADIMILTSHKILTSRLAVIIYRLANLNLNASATEVGRYLRQQLYTKSKTYNYRLIFKLGRSKKLIGDSDLSKKNFKAYDLEINECEIAIRREIAESLTNLKEYDLDTETISRVTKLPILEVQSMFNKQ